MTEYAQPLTKGGRIYLKTNGKALTIITDPDTTKSQAYTVNLHDIKQLIDTGYGTIEFSKLPPLTPEQLRTRTKPHQ